MSVIDAGRRLLAVGRGPASESEWKAATEDFRRELTASTDAAALSALLDEDVTDDLPIAEKTATFERLLTLGLRTPELLRRFADHLWLHGPESDGRVAALREEADRSSGR